MSGAGGGDPVKNLARTKFSELIITVWKLGGVDGSAAQEAMDTLWYREVILGGLRGREFPP